MSRCSEPYCVDGYVPSEPDGEPAPCPKCSRTSKTVSFPHLMEELEDMFRGRGDRPGGYDLRRIAGQAKAEIERLQRERAEDGNALGAAQLELCRLRAALEIAAVALDDWTRTYAPEFCDSTKVEETHNRIAEMGTLAYIAEARHKIRLAMGPADETAERPWPRETAWLVERGDSGPPRYRTMEQGSIVWTDDVNKALRFARRQDAEMFCAEDADAWRVVEHMWTGPAVETSDG